MDEHGNPWGEGLSNKFEGTAASPTDEEIYCLGPGMLDDQTRQYIGAIQHMASKLEQVNGELHQQLSDLTVEVTSRDITIKKLQDDHQRALASLGKGEHVNHPIQGTVPAQGQGRVFSMKVGDLPKFNGKREGGAVLGWLKQLERQFVTRSLELELPVTDTGK